MDFRQPFGDGAQTLCITLKDDVLKLEVELRYSVFEGNDAVIRSAVITNYGDKPLYIEKYYLRVLNLDMSRMTT